MIHNKLHITTTAVAVILSQVAHTQVFAFAPECTIPPSGTSWVSAPPIRSTLSIVWDCLAILILCTWSIQHLNIPLQRPRVKGFWRNFKGYIPGFLSKAKWMVIAIFIPEYLVGRAMVEYMAARHGVKNIQKLYLEKKSETDLEGGLTPEAKRLTAQGEPCWEAIHVYMANAGYFVLDTGVLAQSCSEKSLPSNEAILRGRYWALNHRQWEVVGIEKGCADLPKVKAEDLENLDRKSAIVTILAILQVTSHIIQLIARKANKLPSTQLEIATLAFAVPSAIVYLLCWSRPQGVESIHESKLNLSSDRLTGDSEQSKLENLRKELHQLGHSYFFSWYHPDTSLPPKTDLDKRPIPIPNGAVPWSPLPTPSTGRSFLGFPIDELTGEWDYLSLGFVYGGVAFGGLHLLAWNSLFRSEFERICWRVCSILVMIMPISMVKVAGAAWEAVASRIPSKYYPENYFPKIYTQRGYSQEIDFIVDTIGRLLYGLVYILARLFLLVEMFVSLAYLPPEAFQSTWAGLLPHWG